MSHHLVVVAFAAVTHVGALFQTLAFVGLVELSAVLLTVEDDVLEEHYILVGGKDFLNSRDVFGAAVATLDACGRVGLLLLLALGGLEGLELRLLVVVEGNAFEGRFALALFIHFLTTLLVALVGAYALGLGAIVVDRVVV